jgi:hypothetical protein
MHLPSGEWKWKKQVGEECSDDVIVVGRMCIYLDSPREAGRRTQLLSGVRNRVETERDTREVAWAL